MANVIKDKTFWEILEMLDWEHEGNDEDVIEPVVNYLSQQSDDFIFSFDEKIAEYLYAIDGRKWAEQCQKAWNGVFSDDGFLYCRCVAIVNGEDTYNSILAGKGELNGDLEFESILYTPHAAWARKHKCEESDYPYLTTTSYETGSNNNLWK